MGLPGAVDGTLSEMLQSPTVWRSEEEDSKDPASAPLKLVEHWGYIGNILYWACMGMFEKKMETTFL